MKERKYSLNIMHNHIIMLVPIVAGFALIFAVLFSEVYIENLALQNNITTYETQIKDRMKSDVENALSMIGLYALLNGEQISKESFQEEIGQILGFMNTMDLGYYFAVDYEGNVIYGPGQGTNQFHIEDKNGNKVVQMLIQEAKNGGGYVNYQMPAIEGSVQDPKISYVMPVGDLEIYLGEGYLLSDIEKMKDAYQKEKEEWLFRILLVLIIGVVIMVVLTRFINRKIYGTIETEITKIINFLDTSKHAYQKINVEDFKYEELRKIASHTDRLVDSYYENQDLLIKQLEEIRCTSSQLEEVNITLEEEIHEHNISLSELEKAHKRFETILSGLPDVIFILDKDGVFVDFEGADKSWLLDVGQDYRGKKITDYLPQNIANTCLKKLHLAIKTNQIQSCEYDLVDPESGEVSYYEVRLMKYEGDQGIAVLSNTTELKRAKRDYEYLSYHDQLTSVYNRRYFEEKIIEIDSKRNLPIAIAMLDVNGLKLTNDAFGHQVGDAMLKTVSRILQEVCVENFFVSRVGGDEFLLVSTKTNEHEIKAIIRKIYERIENACRADVIISVSIGFAIKTEAVQKITDVIKKAEENMYSKKVVESQSMRNQTVRAIMNTLNEKNAREKLHSERVSKICRLMGDAMKLDSITVKELETAGLLHDIGKISINENILDKDGGLSDDEYAQIKRHTESSYQILKSIDAYAGLADDVLSHHERWDGKGYPRGISGEEISLIARIIAVADSYEAMTADRSYRKAMSKEYALQELKNNSGTQFDPNVVKIFCAKVSKEL